jgi:hypothetical protein
MALWEIIGESSTRYVTGLPWESKKNATPKEQRVRRRNGDPQMAGAGRANAPKKGAGIKKEVNAQPLTPRNIWWS